MSFLRLATFAVILTVIYFTEGLTLYLFRPLIHFIAIFVISWLLTSFCYRRLVLPTFGRSIQPTSDLAVLITGCDTGLGLATAERLNQRGFFIFACCLSLESEGAVRLSVLENVHVIKCDVTSDDDIARVKTEVTSILGYSTKCLHGIVNNAGVSILGMIEWTNNINLLIQTMNVNLFGTVRVTKAFLPLIRSSKGRIVNMSSVACRDVALACTDYSLSKAGVTKFSECLDMEVSSFGVKVITIEPFFFKSIMTDSAASIKNLTKLFEECDDQIKEAYSDLFDKVMEQARLSERFHTSSPEKATKAIDEALTSSDPNSFYRPGYPVMMETLSLYLPYDVLLPMRRMIPFIFGLTHRYSNRDKTDEPVLEEEL